MKALFVCMGNTCRSPLAAAMFTQLAPEGHSADSCGLAASDGREASYGSRNISKNYNISLSEHRTKPISSKLIVWADKIYCMTQTQAAMLRSDYPDFKAKITTLSSRDIDDPFGGDERVYGSCAEEIYDAVREITRTLK
jgi:protein-tyrosine phosphatase